MIPKQHETAVASALQTACGTDAIDEITEITIGLSNALTYRIVVKEKSYLLKIAHTNQLSDPAYYYACMQAGADAGIAPRVLYANAHDKISITDFIVAQPFPPDKARQIMPGLLRSLHRLPRLDKSVDYFDAMDRMVQALLAKKILPPELAEEFSLQYSRIREVYPFGTELVFCHNDLKPENYLFDGERAWLVDWEAAFTNDRYIDLAVVANFTAETEEDETGFLRAYFGEEPTALQSARLFAMQQLLHVYYTAVFMLYASKTIPIDAKLETVDFKTFHRLMWEGNIDLANDRNKLEYALVHLRQLQYDAHTERLNKALRILRESAT